MNNPEVVAKRVLLLAWLPFILIVGLVLFFDVDPSQVSRYGALVVFFGVVGEYAIYSYKLRMLELKLSQLRDQCDPNFTVELSDSAKADLAGEYDRDGFWAYQLHSTVALGTIIWGYGDVFAGWLCRLVCT